MPATYSHIRRCRKAYAERQGLFLELFRCSDLALVFEHTDGGINLTGFLPDGSDDRSWSHRHAEADLDVSPLSSYAVKPIRPGLVFGFTAFPPPTIKAAFHQVRSLLPPP